MVALIAFLAMAGPVRAEATADEIKLGKEGCAEIEKQYKLIDDKPQLLRLQTILTKLGAASDEPKINYTVKIIDTKDVNAISLPGGPIYVTKGLLGYVQSDHEMAGVLAHEVTHIAHHHMVKLIKRQSKMDTGMIWMVLAAVIAGKYESEGFQGAMLGAQLLKVAKVNGYGQELENEADQGGLTTMTKAGYNPVGILTFMERLAVDDTRKASIDMGIYQTHPDSALRARALEKKLVEMGVKIDRRAVMSSKQALARTSKVDGKDVAEVVLNNDVLFRPAATDPAKPNTARAEAAAKQINDALVDGAQMFEVSVRGAGPTASILVRGRVALEIAQADVIDPAKQTPRAVADEIAAKLRKALWKESLDRTY